MFNNENFVQYLYIKINLPSIRLGHSRRQAPVYEIFHSYHDPYQHGMGELGCCGSVAKKISYNCTQPAYLLVKGFIKLS